MMLTTRHHHSTSQHDCDICHTAIPIGARAVRVGFALPNPQSPSGARRHFTQRYHNRCWVVSENEIKSGQIPGDYCGRFGMDLRVGDVAHLRYADFGSEVLSLTEA